MAKVAVILPHGNLMDTMRSMLHLAHMEQALVLTYGEDHTQIPLLVDQARRQGAEIILTRGLIAQRVRQCSNIPVVEMRITAQELGLLIQKAKTLTRNPTPTIAIVGTRNMFCDYSRFNELFQITLSSYLAGPDAPDPYEELASQASMAVNDHVDVIIGGTTACAIALKHDIPSVFLSATPDSIQEGLRNVRRVAYAIDLEKNNASEMQTMLDSSFSVLIRFDRDGYITTVNRAALNRLDWKTHDIYGRPILSLIKGISQQQLQQILYTGKTLHSAFITIDADQFVANLMPIRTAKGEIIGGVMSCDEVQRIETVGADIRREQRKRHHPAIHSFAQFDIRNEKMRSLIETAKRFAQSDSPVLLRHEPGCYPQILAECIHNAGEQSEMPFVSVSCGELSPEEQLRLMFGDAQADYPVSRSLCALAHMGTLYLENPESLCPPAQGRLRRLLTQKVLLNNENASPYPLDIRIIVSSTASTEQWNKTLDPSLCMLFSGLFLELPTLRDLPEELEHISLEYLNRYQKKYQRHLSITEGGKAWFLQQVWPGNYVQLERFCERLVLSASRRSVDEKILTALYQETIPVLPQTFGHTSCETTAENTAYLPPEAIEIQKTLVKNLGNRGNTARELGISTSTLWRKINKYHITLCGYPF